MVVVPSVVLGMRTVTSRSATEKVVTMRLILLVGQVGGSDCLGHTLGYIANALSCWGDGFLTTWVFHVLEEEIEGGSMVSIVHPAGFEGRNMRWQN